MKFIAKILSVLAAIALSVPAGAANNDVEIHCVAKKLSEKSKPGEGPGGTAVTKQEWAYEVTIENKTFRDLTNIEVKYVVFYSQQRLGQKADPKAKRHAGTITVPVLRPREKKVVTTNPTQLTKANLVGDYYFIDGAKIKVEDALTGLWVRLYQNGQQFAEYANPSQLTKEPWEQ